jgi:hypothetical protein
MRRGDTFWVLTRPGTVKVATLAATGRAALPEHTDTLWATVEGPGHMSAEPELVPPVVEAVAHPDPAWRAIRMHQVNAIRTLGIHRHELRKVSSQTLAQAGDFGRSTRGSLRPVIDLVPGVLGRGASVPNHHVLVEVLEPCVDHHRVHRVDVELGTQRSRRVPNGSSDR